VFGGGLHAPMLARLERRLPIGDGWRYEPKLDGFRGLLWRAPSGSVYLLSRNVKNLSHAFPEVLTGGRDLPLDTLVDGEIVIADGRSNFGALQQRLGKATRDAAREALRSPAVLLAFDLVRDAGVELVDQPLRDRRRRLEALLGPTCAYLQLVAQTASLAEAEEWLAYVPGLEGVIAKRFDSRSVPKQRDWVKVKRQRTGECAVIGIARDRAQPTLVLGLRHADGELHHFGVTRPAKAHALSTAL
jgi:ATP-dependent DNA ligase